MKTLILYASKHGCAEKCAIRLGERLGGDPAIVDIHDAAAVDLADYDAVAVGGSIRAGKIQKEVRAFCDRNLAVLKAKRLGLFICCMMEGAKAEEEFTGAFPAELIGAAAAKGLFGGEINLEKMRWLERTIIKKASKISGNVSRIDDNAIADFAKALGGHAS
jgi:menaquinone-dependent protoporphyrinogen oxidase